MKIIGIGHRKKVGKDTLARFITTEYKLNPLSKDKFVVKRGFADQLKSICYSLYKWAGHRSPEYYEANPDEKEEVLTLIGKSVRQIWIETGNKMREIYPMVWVDYLLQGTQDADLLLIKDLRFHNEVVAIKDRGGYVIRVDRDQIQKDNDGADDPLADYDKWDMIIDNSGLANDLYDKATEIVERLTIGDWK